MEEETYVGFINKKIGVLKSKSLKEALLDNIKKIDYHYIFDLNEEEIVNIALFSLLETYIDHHNSETENLAQMKVFLMASTIEFYIKNVEVEEKSNVNPFVLLSYSSDVMGDIEGISEFKAISELKKEFESIPFKYYKSDSSETFKEVKEKYPSIAHLSEVSDLYVPEVLDKLSSEITFLEDLNSAPLESLTEETYFSISDYLKKLKSIKAVEEESVEAK